MHILTGYYGDMHKVTHRKLRARITTPTEHAAAVGISHRSRLLPVEYKYVVTVSSCSVERTNPIRFPAGCRKAD